MTSAPRALGPPDALELLDRSVGYTRGCLALVRPELMTRPTPCARWSLRDLLSHMDDSLSAMAEAVEAPSLELVASAGPRGVEDLLASIRQRACSLVGQWAVRPADDDAEVALGRVHLARQTLGSVGALEITIHGWDVAQACGSPRPVPPELAADLLPVALVHITTADRPHRFAAALDVPVLARAPERLLAQAGRRAGWEPGGSPPG